MHQGMGAVIAHGFAACCQHRTAKPLVFLLALLPAFYLTGAAVLDQLGANPAETLIRATGDWTLRALCVVLAAVASALVVRRRIDQLDLVAALKTRE